MLGVEGDVGGHGSLGCEHGPVLAAELGRTDRQLEPSLLYELSTSRLAQPLAWLTRA
jgi:hypothetical protein